MSSFIKRSNQFKVRDAEYKPWNLRKVIETYAGRPYDEVLKEQQEKRRKINEA